MRKTFAMENPSFGGSDVRCQRRGVPREQGETLGIGYPLSVIGKTLKMLKS